MGWVIFGIAVLLIVLGVFSFGLALVAGSDPEGRGGKIVDHGLLAALACCVGLVADIGFAIYHYWLS